MGGWIPGAIPVQVFAAFAPPPAVVLGDGGLEYLRAVGPGDPLLAAPDWQLPAHLRLHRQRFDPKLERLAVQRTARAALETRPVQKDAGALVLSGSKVGLILIGVHLQVALAAHALLVELPVGLSQLRHRGIEVGAVVVIGEERSVRTASVVGTARHGALAGRCAEDACPVRQQPGQVGGDKMLVIGWVVELNPFAGEVQVYLAGVLACHDHKG